MDNPVDLLREKISDAKKQLPEDARRAIEAIDWRSSILEIKEKRGYTIEQLGNLDTETELLLCGLLSPQDYPRELERRMKISGEQANELVKEMNEKVFSKIKEELIKNTEQKNKTSSKEEKPDILKSAGIEIVPEKPEAKPAPTQTKEEPLPILAQKLSGFSKNEVVKTEHTLENITRNTESPAKSSLPASAQNAYPPNSDPYRLPPE